MIEPDATPLDPRAPMSADALGSRLRRGDAASLDDLFRLAGRRAFGLAYRVLEDSRLAEDVVQDAFLWLWEHNERVDPTRGSVEALLMTVVHRRAVDAYRARIRRERRINPFTSVIAEEVDRRAASVLGDAGPALSPARVREALNGLPIEQRQVIELAFFEGATQAEVAAKLALPLGTVKSRIRLAMQKLRGSLGLEAAS